MNPELIWSIVVINVHNPVEEILALTRVRHTVCSMREIVQTKIQYL